MVGQLEVEAGIVHQHHPVGAHPLDGSLGRAQVAQHLGQVRGHVDKAHVGHAAIVYQGLAARGGGHLVATQKVYPGLGVEPAQGGYDVRGMEVARCLAG